MCVCVCVCVCIFIYELLINKYCLYVNRIKKNEMLHIRIHRNKKDRLYRINSLTIPDDIR